MCACVCVCACACVWGRQPTTFARTRVPKSWPHTNPCMPSWIFKCQNRLRESRLTIERLTCYAVIHFQIGFKLPRWLILHTDVLTEFSFAIFSSFWNTEQTDDSYTHSVTSPCKKIILCRIWPGLAFSENRVALMSVGLIIVVKVGHDFALQIRVHGSVCPTRIIKCMCVCVCVLLHRRTFLDGARWASLIHSLQLQALI